jgi:hypothetical protein
MRPSFALALLPLIAAPTILAAPTTVQSDASVAVAREIADPVISGLQSLERRSVPFIYHVFSHNQPAIIFFVGFRTRRGNIIMTRVIITTEGTAKVWVLTAAVRVLVVPASPAPTAPPTAPPATPVVPALLVAHLATSTLYDVGAVREGTSQPSLRSWPASGFYQHLVWSLVAFARWSVHFFCIRELYRLRNTLQIENGMCWSFQNRE